MNGVGSLVKMMSKHEAYSLFNCRGYAGDYQDPIIYGPGNGCPSCHCSPCQCIDKHNAPFIPLKPSNQFPMVTGQICPLCNTYICSQSEMFWHLKNHILLKKLGRDK